MTRNEANLHAVSLCASFVIAMLGLTHEVVGPTLFPWAPEWFGLIAWHGIGIAAIVLGLICLSGVLGMISVPLVSLGVAAGIGGIAAIALMAVKAQQFHYFAMWLTIAGFALAIAQHRVGRLHQGA